MNTTTRGEGYGYYNFSVRNGATGLTINNSTFIKSRGVIETSDISGLTFTNNIIDDSDYPFGKTSGLEFGPGNSVITGNIFINAATMGDKSSDPLPALLISSNDGNLLIDNNTFVDADGRYAIWASNDLANPINFGSNNNVFNLNQGDTGQPYELVELPDGSYAIGLNNIEDALLPLTAGSTTTVATGDSMQFWTNAGLVLQGVESAGELSINELDIATQGDAFNLNEISDPVLSAFDVAPDAGFNLGAGSAVLSFIFDPSKVAAAGLDETDLRLLHYENGQWVDVTGYIDTEHNVIYSVALSSFSPFALTAIPEPSSLMLLIMGMVLSLARSPWRTVRN